MTKTLQAAAQALYSACCNYGSQREQDIRDAARQYEAALSAPPPSEEEAVKDLETCNCRWRGEEQVQQCTLHEAHVHAIHEWAERAKTAEATLQVHRVGGQPAGDPAMPVVGEVRESNKFGLYFWRDMTHASQVGERLVRQSDALAAIAAARQERVPDDLRKFLDAAAGDGLECGGVDAAELYLKLWPPNELAADVAAAPKPDAPAQATPDQVIDLACALEQRRALHIVAEVAALQIGGADSQTPTPFQAGYALACEEICTRLRTQQWELCGVPSPLPPAGSAG